MNSILGNLYFAVAPHAFACLVLQGFSSPEFTSVISDSLRFVSSFVNIKGIQKVHVWSRQDKICIFVVHANLFLWSPIDDFHFLIVQEWDAQATCTCASLEGLFDL